MAAWKSELGKGGSGADDSQTPPTAKAKHNRSRGGCTRCRKRRQKCDEEKPKCKRCEADGEKECVYEVSIQWGGRNFQHFARNENIKKHETEPGNFVYVASSARKLSSSPRQSRRSSPTVLTSPGRSISPLETTKPMERLLLHHFAHEASRITSCHPRIQSDFCQLLLPMALSYRPLLAALMALSAIHRNSLYTPRSLTSSSSSTFLSSPIASTPEGDAVISLKTSSISQLRRELLQPSSESGMRDTVLATVLTLCMCEIHSGADQPRSWRLHLEGAKAILSSHGNSSRKVEVRDAPIHDGLLGRWYTSIAALAAISDGGLKAGQLSPASSGYPYTATGVVRQENASEVYLDDYFGFSTDLAQVFIEIGALAHERRSLSCPSPSHVSLSDADLELEATALESHILPMITRDFTQSPKFFPGVREQLPPKTIKEFQLCNEAYQNTALLHIYRRVLLLEKNDEKVQDSVKRVLECVRGIRPQGGLSPYIVLNVPLFTAGRDAIGDDRDAIRGHLIQLAQMTGLRNIKRGLEILESMWGSGQEGLLNDEECDFIPY